ncbi:hypothetical protein H0H92_006110 [Tricholoma furcatifolium]|nr:hypothetical protein H0H92_006110 [Tricholoma furcatifolium]
MHIFTDAEIVQNAFWTVQGMDLHRALSYDTLHFDDNGLWEDHFFKVFKSIITSREDIVRIDSAFDTMPRWRGLNHFESVMNITFNDGTKNCDISKIFLFAAHNVLSKDLESNEHLLLRCLRSYLSVRMYAGLNLHTESTILAGQKELQDVFIPLMEQYINSVGDININGDLLEQEGDDEDDEPPRKSWNFVKLHLRQHLFDDIRNKGVSRNYNTKINEKMHGPVKTTYLRRTNFKNYDKQAKSLLPDPEEDSASDETGTASAVHVTAGFDSTSYDRVRILGSPTKATTFAELQESHRGDTAYSHFRTSLGAFLTRFLPAYNISLPQGRPITFRAGDSITEYRYLKVQYTCTSDWEVKTDYLRCNPNFHGHPRFDCVLVNSEPQPYFARIITLFTCIVANESYPLALIQPFASVYTHLNRRRKDIELKLLRFRANLRKDFEFISIHAIIRGAVMVPSGELDFANGSRDYFLFDLLDADMFLRVQNDLL